MSADEEKLDLNCGEMSEGERKELEVILSEYQDRLLGFPESRPPDIPFQHWIILKDEILVSSNPHRCARLGDISIKNNFLAVGR